MQEPSVPSATADNSFNLNNQNKDDGDLEGNSEPASKRFRSVSLYIYKAWLPIYNVLSLAPAQ